MLKERLIKFIKNQGLTISAFEVKVGLSNGSVSRTNDNMRRRTVEAITEAFPNLNETWLLTGEGEMLKSNTTNKALKVRDEAPVTLVPLIPATAFAGFVDGFNPDSISEGDYPMIATPAAGAELAIPISGDSMEPEYPNGSIAYIRKINDAAFIPWGHTVLLDTENGAFIKKIYPDEDNSEYIYAKSINPEYPPIHIPKASIYRIFRVLGTTRLNTTM